MFKNIGKNRISRATAIALMVGSISVISSPMAHAAAGDITSSAQTAGGTAFATNGAAGTATIHSNGTITLAVAACTAACFVNVTGGTFTAVTSGGSIAVGGASITSSSATALVALVATPTAAGTNMVISSFEASSSGTAYDVVTVTVIAAAGMTIAANGVAGTIGEIVAPTTTVNAKTMTITSDGAVGFTTIIGGVNEVSALTVSGGTISSVSAITDGSPNAARTSLVFGDVAVAVVVKPNAGVTSMVIKSFSTANQITTGTNVDKITVTVVAATTVGTISTSNSETNWVAYGTSISSSAVADLTNIDVAGAKIIGNGLVGQIGYSLNDGNGIALPASGVVSVVSSNPLIAVSFDGVFANTEIAKANTTAYGQVYVLQAVANTPATGTITFKYNGTAYSTKSVTMQGDIASIVVADIYSGKTGVSGTIATAGSAIDATAAAVLADAGSFSVVAKDAAGNVLGGKIVAADTTRYNNVVSAITLANSSTTIKFSATAGLTAGPGTGSLLGTFSCPTSTEGTGGTKQRLKITNAALVTIYSNEFDATCGGSPDSYTASLDKASYVPGDIATLTITAKTSTGKAPYSAATTGTATTAVGITQGSQMTPVTAIAVTDKLGNTGVVTYKFVVGTTEGSYNMIVDLPKWSVANGYAGAAQTAKYSVAASTATVSNADVLKSIVALIASINKQIQALQKLILARR